MPRFTDDVFAALAGVAISSEADVVGRVDALRALARTCLRSGDAPGADAAFAAAGAALDRARELGDGVEVAKAAHSAGYEAESLGRQARARALYEVALRAFGADSPDPENGIVWHRIGNTWRAEKDEGSALGAYRTAADLKRARNDGRSRLITLKALAEAEALAGTRDQYELAIAEGIQVLEATLALPKPSADLARIAHGAGRVAERFGAQQLARRVYELTLELVEAGCPDPPPSILWRDIGDTWAAEGERRNALVAYRAAAHNRRDTDHPIDRLSGSTALALAEAEAGDRAAAESVLVESVELLGGFPTPLEQGSTVSGCAARLSRLADALGRSDLATTCRIAAGELTA